MSKGPKSKTTQTTNFPGLQIPKWTLKPKESSSNPRSSQTLVVFTTRHPSSSNWMVTSSIPPAAMAQLGASMQLVIWFGSPGIQQQAVHHPSLVGRPTARLTPKEPRYPTSQRPALAAQALRPPVGFSVMKPPISNSGATWSLVATMKRWK